MAANAPKPFPQAWEMSARTTTSWKIRTRQAKDRDQEGTTMKLRNLWFSLCFNLYCLKWRLKTIVCRRWYGAEKAKMLPLKLLVDEMFGEWNK